MLTIVTGPPCSGKTTYIQQHAKQGDLVYDMDAIAQALGSPDAHDHPPAIRAVARDTRHVVVKACMQQAAQGHDAWIVDSHPSPRIRGWYKSTGARIIDLTAPLDTLRERANTRSNPGLALAAIDAYTWEDQTPQRRA